MFRIARVAAVATIAAIAAATTVVALPSAAYAQSPPAAPTTIAVGDWQLLPSFELRTRGEYRRDPPDLGGFDSYGRLDSRVRDSWVVSERTRLGLGAEHGAVRAQITLQDARAFGAPAPTATVSTPAGERGAGQLAPYEAYLEVRSSSARPSFFRLGRQAVVWGEGRLIGNADFSPTGRSLDAARAHLAAGNFDVEALAVILEVPGPLGTSFGDRTGQTHSGVQLYGLTGRWSIDPLLHLEAFALARISRSSGDTLDGSRFALARLAGETYTGALRVSGEAKGWTYGLEGAYQLGNAASLTVGGSDIAAYAAAAHVSKTLPEVALTPTFRIGGSYASGDDGSGTYKQFDPLLPDPQRFHGQMDLFGWSNAIDVSGRVQVVPWTDTTFALEYRYARLAEASGEWIGSYLTAIGRAAPPQGFVAAGYAPITPSGDTELGHELDAVLSWRPWLPLELRAGWSGLLLGDGARGIMAAYARGRADDAGVVTPSKIAHYAYGQMTLTMP
jgi:hypothetical protein